MFTEKQINEILAVCEKATPGPWEVEHGEWDCNWECGHKAGDPECHKEICECEHIKQYIPANVRPLFTVDCGDFMGLSDDNADFIALARTALPQLAEELIKLRAVAEAGKISLRHCLPEPNEDEECVVCDGYPDACPQCEAGKLREALITLIAAGYGGEE